MGLGVAMSNYIRARGAGASYFFTLCLAEGQEPMLTKHIELLRSAYAGMMLSRPVRTRAIVILPDHLHAVWTLPDGDGDFSTRWAVFKSQFTRLLKQEVGWKPTLRSWSKIKKKDAGLWQRRFWEHQIRDAQDMQLHVEYCWSNPVKHGFCASPVDWPFSSLHREIRNGTVGPDWRRNFEMFTGGERPQLAQMKVG